MSRKNPRYKAGHRNKKGNLSESTRQVRSGGRFLYDGKYWRHESLRLMVGQFIHVEYFGLVPEAMGPIKIFTSPYADSGKQYICTINLPIGYILDDSDPAAIEEFGFVIET